MGIHSYSGHPSGPQEVSDNDVRTGGGMGLHDQFHLFHSRCKRTGHQSMKGPTQIERQPCSQSKLWMSLDREGNQIFNEHGDNIQTELTDPGAPLLWGIQSCKPSTIAWWQCSLWGQCFWVSIAVDIWKMDCCRHQTTDAFQIAFQPMCSGSFALYMDCCK